VLKVGGRLFCNAKTVLSVTNPEIEGLLVKGYGFGQLFQHLQRIPKFELLECAKDAAKLWRRYTLSIPEGMDMEITEVYPPNIFELDFDGPETFDERIWDTVPEHITCNNSVIFM